MSRPVRALVTDMPRSKWPEQMRANAMRSRCDGSMFACTLNTNALNGAARGRDAPELSARGDGGGANWTTASSSVRTPKLVSAEPMNTGVDSPARNDGRSRLAPIACSNPTSSIAVFHARRASGGGSADASATPDVSSSATDAPRAVRVKRVYMSVRRSISPTNSSPLPTGQVTGVGRSRICDSISSSSSSGSRPGRSYLLRNVITGRLRERHTWNNFSVWLSMPLAASSTITTASTADKTRYVSSLKSR